MSSSSRWIAGGRTLALALAFASAGESLGPQVPQDTAHKQGTMQMPMNMPMGKKPQKKKPVPKTIKANTIGVAKTAAKTGKKPAPANKTSKIRPVNSQPMAMPMGAESHHAPAQAAQMQMSDTTHASSKPTDTAHIGMPGMHHSADDMMIGPVGVSMERMGSGTTWVPDAVTLPSRRRMLGDWMIMAHGFAFAQYDKQSGERGDDQFGSLNWGMLMGTT